VHAVSLDVISIALPQDGSCVHCLVQHTASWVSLTQDTCSVIYTAPIQYPEALHLSSLWVFALRRLWSYPFLLRAFCVVVLWVFALRVVSPDLKFNQSQVVLPFCLSHTESLWLTLTHSAVDYSSPLGITNLHYSPYQSLTNHPSNQCLSCCLSIHDSYPYDSYALCHCICSFNFDLLIPCFPPLSFGPHAMIFPYSWLYTPFYLCFCSFPWLSSLFRLSPSMTQPDYTAYWLLTNFLPISYQALSHLCLQGHSPSCINTSSQRLQGRVCFLPQ